MQRSAVNGTCSLRPTLAWHLHLAHKARCPCQPANRSHVAASPHFHILQFHNNHNHCTAALSQRSMVYLSGADAAEVPEEGADSLKLQLQNLEEERKAATAKAESLATKGKRLAEAITNLQHGALQAMKAGDEAAARELLQEKATVSTALDKAKSRAAINFSLAERLNKLIGAKQTELIALLHRTGQQYGLPAKPFSVGPTGLISVDDDSADSAAGSGAPETEEASTPQQQLPQQPTTAPGSYRRLAMDSQDDQVEENMDKKFLELERSTLESMLQASSMSTDKDSTDKDSTNKDSTEKDRVDKASKRGRDSSADQAQRTASGAQAGTSGSEPAGTGWWQSASDKLEGVKNEIGSLEAHQAREMAKDVTIILTRMINARVMRGQDPKAAQLIELAQLQVGVQASADPTVRIMPPKTDFTSNIRQRLFRDAVAAAIQACSASSPGGQLPSWQELAAKWSSQLDPVAKDFSAARNAVLAQMFLRSMAQLLKIEHSDAQRIVHAAIAAHTRARLLDSLAIIKQVEGSSKKDVARGQMQQLAAVVDAFPLPEHSPEMELVYSGLRGFLVYEDRLLLYKAYRKATNNEDSRHAMADALGMMY